MERREYERLAAAEERGWWFRGLHANLIRAWQRRSGNANGGVLLDAGCGTGGLLTRLAHAVPSARCYGLEFDPDAAETARAKSGAMLMVGSIVAPPLAAQSCDAIFSADVLCHRGVEPAEALAALAPCLKPRGLLLLNLPAYRWLFSGHDLAVDNVRRFGAGEVRALLRGAGFAEIRIGYWNSLLFPLMVAQRFIHRGAKSDVELLPPLIERLFAATLRCELALAACGLRLPFGGSILATAVKL
ncbi:MAG TPA: methyltransferase domain-containing protein [Stellaceae bacterium]|jgi:SAM-dependent methyltransferase|nr:methyltransferase domain-containing protein [Stellaceae bacterium]